MKQTWIEILKFSQLALAFACTMPLGAATLTWSGGESGDIADAANWGGTAPAAGDTLTIGSVATLTGSFDLGAEGLTLDCGATVTSEVIFSGPGTIIKMGNGELSLKSESSYAGGTLIKAGTVTLYPPLSAGTGLITVDRSAAGVNSSVYFYGTNSEDNAWTVYPNGVYVKGSYVDVTIPGTNAKLKEVAEKAPIWSYYNVQIDGDVTGDGSIFFRNYGYYDTIFNGAVTVPEGSTIVVDGRGGNADTTFKKEVLGSLTKVSSGWSWNSLNLRAASGRATETLAVHEGSAYLQSSGAWRGSTVVVTNLPFTKFGASLYNESKKAYRSDVSIYLATNATKNVKFDLAVADQMASHLYFNGVEMAKGVYTPGMLNDALYGKKNLIVGMSV